MTGIRRILQVHTRYREAGGEDQVVEAERTLLAAAGLEVRQVLFDNAELRESRSPSGDFRLALAAVWSAAALARVRQEIRSFSPQVVHVHNTFAAASPAVYRVATGASPVVATLHNYRLVCPRATLFRDGHACVDCVGRAIPLPGVVHRCVRGSAGQSSVAAVSQVTHAILGTWRRVGLFIALTESQRSLLVRGARLPASRVRVIPNFLEQDPGPGAGPRDGVLFVGRLAEEKGVRPLLEAARFMPRTIRIAGAGPLADEVMAAAGAGIVEALGALGGEVVPRRMQRAVAMVVPSLWFEGFPMVVVEAYATATPVIASRIGSLAEIVEDGVTGLLVDPGDARALSERISWALAHPEAMADMGAAARRRYEMRYRGEQHLVSLLSAYEAARASAPGGRWHAKGSARG